MTNEATGTIGGGVKIGSKKTGAWLARYALEQMPVRFTFGIPGVHTTELYDELGKSERIRPVLVTHEGGASFMGDAVSRTSSGQIGVLVIVPAAGLTHAMSGIGEAFLAGIPLLVISGGPRTDIDYGFQLHELDQHRIVAGLTKASWKVTAHRDVVPTLFEAYRVAVTGCPGPVFVEIPVNIQLFQGDVGEVPAFEQPPAAAVPSGSAIEEAVALLSSASRPGIFVGWGAVDAVEETVRIADLLGAPVATTLQGMSAFPGNHPLHVGMGFSRAAVPAARHAFEDVDCLLAAGTRFAEIPTGSFGAVVPGNLVHVDIDPNVFNRNYKAKVAIEGDARVVLPMLRERLEAGRPRNGERRARSAARIAADKKAFKAEWYAHVTDRVNPAMFFDELRRQLSDEAILVVDDGNHTYLAAEHYEVRRPRSFVSPTDFNCMGYCVPAAIGARLANPDKPVAAIVGDGAFLMTGLEVLTAAAERAGVAYFVFADGELSQISQGQQIPYNRKVCTVIGDLRLDGVARATGAGYVAIESNARIAGGIREALDTAASGQPVIVDVRIDYSKRTCFTQGVVKTVVSRFPLRDRVRFVGRAIVRKITG
jgi:acetolactate synthase-1/2/3 large subunit